jgi:hypothetical protein
MALEWLKSRLNPTPPPMVPAQRQGPPCDPPAGRAPSNRRNQRVDAEVLMIAQRFSHPPYQGIYYDDENRDWLVIPNYPLPTRFQERRCDLLIVFPETYPDTPPIGFYLNRKFNLQQGGHDPHLTSRAYHDAPDLTNQGWHWYCVQMDMRAPGAWRPRPDPGQPDNLWTFLNMVREALTNDA